MNESLFKNLTNATLSVFAAALAGVQKRQWIVGSLDENGNFSFSAKPVTHMTERLALDEAKRLASLNPGKAFVAVRFVGGFLVPKVVGAYEL